MGVKLNTASGGSVSIEPTNTASNYTLTVPAQTGTVVASDSSGNVQVGMSAGTRKLNVQGYIGAFHTSGTNDSHIAIYNDGSTSNITSTYTSTGSYLPMAFQTGGAERARFDTSGNLGIGIVPAANRGLLQVYATGNQTDESGAVSFGNTASGAMRMYFGVNNANSYTYIGSVQSGTAYRKLIIQPNGGDTQVNGNLLFNSGYGSAATAYGCRAWVNFNGTGTPSIRASGNVSSITDDGTGVYTLNFSTAMPDTNYSYMGFTRKDNDSASGYNHMASLANDTKTTSAVRVRTTYGFDVTEINVAVFR